MKELKYLIIHCTDTRPAFRVTRTILEQWHKGPLDVKDSKGNIVQVRYLGRVYHSRNLLPLDFIGDKLVSDLHGRGWDRLGYSDMILRDGQIINLTSYDNDRFVEYNEVTWGVTGINAESRHVVLEGGRTPDNKSKKRPFLDIFTHSQFVMLVNYCKQFLKDYPGTFISAHYVFDSHKTCPNIDIIEELHRNAGIPAKYIYV
jgi:N-acetylmuramoyl-L-alanine amidase